MFGQFKSDLMRSASVSAIATYMQTDRHLREVNNGYLLTFLYCIEGSSEWKRAGYQLSPERGESLLDGNERIVHQKVIAFFKEKFGDIRCSISDIKMTRFGGS